MPITYDKIATTTLSSTSATITFSSITGSYTDLRLVFVGTAASGDIKLRLNGDTTAAYSRNYVYGNQTISGAYTGNDTDFVYLNTSALSASTLHFCTVDLLNYANGSYYKNFLYTSSEDKNGTGNVLRGVALWRSTVAITSIDLFGATFAIGTTATLYGILKA